jgi:hypothetical protein
MQNVAPIVQAFASLLWSVFAFTVLFVFKREIAQAIGRLKKGKFLGQEVELGEDLRKLEAAATAAVQEVEALSREENRLLNPALEDEFDATVKSILQQAAVSPKIALIMLQTELEKRARHALASRGLLAGRPNISLRSALSELGQYGLPQNMSGSLKLFREVRDKIIHGQEATDDDILQAIDSGITILKALNALPNEVNIVFHPGVEIFTDAACTSKIPDAKGVILETTSPGGAIKSFRIFPTTKTHFQKGKQVAWEWDDAGRIWGAAWYRDPTTKEIKQAWVQSIQFIGRHLDDV